MPRIFIVEYGIHEYCHTLLLMEKDIYGRISYCVKLCIELNALTNY